MKLNFLCFLCFIVCSFCCNKNSIINKDVTSISIYSISDNRKNEYIGKTNDSKKMSELIKIINQGKKKPLKFISNYKLEMKYNKNTVTILINNNMFLHEGISYEAKENIETIINSLIDQ